MTELMDKIIKQIGQLPDDQQDALAMLLEEELFWNQSFANSQTELGILANEALEELKLRKKLIN